jgi:hypothetical protein
MFLSLLRMSHGVPVFFTQRVYGFDGVPHGLKPIKLTYLSIPKRFISQTQPQTFKSFPHIVANRRICERKKQTRQFVFAVKERSSCTSGGTSALLQLRSVQAAQHGALSGTVKGFPISSGCWGVYSFRLWPVIFIHFF